MINLEGRVLKVHMNAAQYDIAVDIYYFYSYFP